MAPRNQLCCPFWLISSALHPAEALNPPSPSPQAHSSTHDVVFHKNLLYSFTPLSMKEVEVFHLFLLYFILPFKNSIYVTFTMIKKKLMIKFGTPWRSG